VKIVRETRIEDSLDTPSVNRMSSFVILIVRVITTLILVKERERQMDYMFLRVERKNDKNRKRQ